MQLMPSKMVMRQINAGLYFLKLKVFKAFISFPSISIFKKSIFLFLYLDFSKTELRIAAGILIILFSLQMLGIFNLSLLNQEKRIETQSYKNNYAFPLLVGAAFAFGWTPCIGPVLGSILALSATEASVSSGVLLLSFYSLGLAIPFLHIIIKLL